MWVYIFIKNTNINTIRVTNYIMDWQTVGYYYLTSIYTVGSHYVAKIMDNTDVQLFMFQSILFYGNVVRKIQSWGKQIYDSHPIITDMVDVTKYSVYFVSSILCHTRVEPMTTFWISTIALDKQNRLTEIYEYDADDIKCDFNNQMYALHSIITSCSNYTEGLILLRDVDQYVCKKVITTTENLVRNNICYPLQKSSVRLLSIQYCHPYMKTNIYIEVPTGMYVVGNEILSPLFVKRCLEYQSENYLFDKTYTLRLIDQNIQESVLTYGEYIILGETYFSVCKD